MSHFPNSANSANSPTSPSEPSGDAYSETIEVPLADLWPLFSALPDAGVFLSGVIDKLGLPAGLFDDPKGYIPLADCIRVWQELSLIFYDESSNLTDRAMIVGTKQFMLDNLEGCATLREGLAKLATVSNFINGAPYCHVRESNDRLMLVLDDSRFPYLQKNESLQFCYMECLLIIVHRLLCYLVGSRDELPEPNVSIKRSIANNNARHLRFWRGNVRYGSSEYILSYDSTVGDVLMVVPEGGYSVNDFYSGLANMLQTPGASSPTQTVGHQIRKILLDEFKSQQQVSEELGMSVATIRRRLTEEGTSFRQVRQAVQQELAISLLEAGFSSYDVAEKLGFSDLRSFSHAFKSWNGVTLAQHLESKG